MLTAIRNICSTIFFYDEHRFGCEESMAIEVKDGNIHIEARKLQMSDQFCRGCHLPHTLDENKRCEFCRRDPAPPRYSVFGRIWRALIAPRQQDISITFK